MSTFRKSARQSQDARKAKKTSQSRRPGIKSNKDGACLHKDFLEAKRNQSQQETRDELATARRNFLKGQEKPKAKAQTTRSKKIRF